jgi:hypothetical protein
MRLGILLTSVVAVAILAVRLTALPAAVDDVIGEAIELLVRGSDGKPVSNAEIRSVAIQPLPEDDHAPRRATARIDVDGEVVMPALPVEKSVEVLLRLRTDKRLWPFPAATRPFFMVGW